MAYNIIRLVSSYTPTFLSTSRAPSSRLMCWSLHPEPSIPIVEEAITEEAITKAAGLHHHSQFLPQLLANTRYSSPCAILNTFFTTPAVTGGAGGSSGNRAFGQESSTADIQGVRTWRAWGQGTVVRLVMTAASASPRELGGRFHKLAVVVGRR